MAIKGRSRANKRFDSLELLSRIRTSHRFPLVHLDAASLTRIFDSNRRETDESADPVRQAGLSLATQDALLRLAANPQEFTMRLAIT